MCLLYKTFENTVGKGEIARNEQFLLFPQRFLAFWKTFRQFHKIQNCRPQTLSVWKSLKFCHLGFVWQNLLLWSNWWKPNPSCIMMHARSQVCTGLIDWRPVSYRNRRPVWQNFTGQDFTSDVIRFHRF